jgi:hypothetical protein
VYIPPQAIAGKGSATDCAMRGAVTLCFAAAALLGAPPGLALGRALALCPVAQQDVSVHSRGTYAAAAGIWVGCLLASKCKPHGTRPCASQAAEALMLVLCSDGVLRVCCLAAKLVTVAGFRSTAGGRSWRMTRQRTLVLTSLECAGRLYRELLPVPIWWVCCRSPTPGQAESGWALQLAAQGRAVAGGVHVPACVVVPTGSARPPQWWMRLPQPR